MRNYQILDSAVVEPDNVLFLSNSEDNPEKPCLSMSREGAFLAFSVSFGPMELALRLRYEEVKRRFERLHPVPGLATTLQVGTANSYIAMGLTQDQRLILRPGIVGDASGHIRFNLVTTSDVYKKIYNWLEISS